MSLPYTRATISARDFAIKKILIFKNTKFDAMISCWEWATKMKSKVLSSLMFTTLNRIQPTITPKNRRKYAIN